MRCRALEQPTLTTLLMASTTEQSAPRRRQPASSEQASRSEQCHNKVKIEVAAGRMQEPGCKRERESWSQAELVQLKAAVDRHGRDWAAVTRDVGSKTRKQCWGKVKIEVAAGRMQEPGGKHER